MRDARSGCERGRPDSRPSRRGVPGAEPVVAQPGAWRRSGGEFPVKGPSSPTQAPSGGRRAWPAAPQGPAATAPRGLCWHPPIAMTKAPTALPCPRSAHAPGGALRHAASGARARLRLGALMRPRRTPPPTQPSRSQHTSPTPLTAQLACGGRTPLRVPRTAPPCCPAPSLRSERAALYASSLPLRPAKPCFCVRPCCSGSTSSGSA